MNTIPSIRIELAQYCSRQYFIEESGSIAWDGRTAQLIFLNSKNEHDIIDYSILAKTIGSILQKESIFEFFAKKENYFMKIIIESNQNGNFLSLYPLEPVVMKEGFDSSEPQLDLGYYIELALQLCDNFAIYDIKTIVE